MNSEHLAHWRMHSLGLTGARFTGPTDAVRRLGAVQSQDYAPAKWSLGERTIGAIDAAVEQAFQRGDILRTHVLRPTWHFVLPGDIRWMLELTAPRVHQFNAYYYRQNELGPDELAASAAVVADALAGGNQLTRKELAAVLEQAGIPASSQRLGLILISAELDGVICSGSRRGAQHTYAVLDERVPPAVNQPSHDEALAELTLRYFTGHGPATPKDFRWWSSLTLTEIRNGLELVGGKLDSEVVDGVTYFFAAPAPQARQPSPTVHLLQAYDEYFVGYTESKYVLDTSRAARSVAPDRPVFNHVLVVDSQVAGCWKRTLTADAVAIDLLLYRPLDAAEARALRVAADRHGEFLGLPASVSTSPL